MNSSAKYIILLTCFVISEATSVNFKNSEGAEKQARTIFTSGGTYFLALNTTYLIYYGILLGIATLALVALSGILGGGSSTSSYGSQSGYSRFGQDYDQHFHHQRQRRGTTWENGRVDKFFYKFYSAPNVNSLVLYSFNLPNQNWILKKGHVWI